MVRVLKLTICMFLISSNFSFAENPVLKDEAQKILKRTRVNSDAALKAWSDKAKKEVQEKVDELKKGDLAPILAASADVALASLKDETFKGQVLDTLKKVDRKDWQEVLKDLSALMKQKNLKIEDIVQNPQIISDYVASISEKEKAFWAERAKESARIPVTETPVDLSIPKGSFEDALKLMKALTAFIKIENIEANSNNLLIRYFVAP
jgi:predicted metal-dependent RNase